MHLKYFYFLLFFAVSFSSANSCWKIKNRDTQALCESKSEHKKNCWKIKSSNAKAYCEASAYGKNSCWKIKERDLQAYCEAEIGR